MLAGGRYDGLIGSLGGPETPGVGWAAGVERLAMLVEGVPTARASIAVVAEDAEFDRVAMEKVVLLRRGQIAAEAYVTGSPKKRYDRALKTGPGAVLSFSRRDGLPATSFRNLLLSTSEEAAVRSALSPTDLT